MVRSTDCNTRYLCYICSIRIDLKAFMFWYIYVYLYCIFLFTLHSLSWICLPYVHLVEYVFVEQGSFVMKKALPVKRWKKEEPPERECFSDEDSDGDDSNYRYEEIVIPKKRQAKINFKASKAASSRRIKPIPKHQMHPKEISAARNTK